MNMKRIALYIILMVAVTATAQAQTTITNYGSNSDIRNKNNTDSTKVNTSKIDPAPYQWRIDEQFGDIEKMPMDTVFFNFQNEHLTEGKTGHFNHIGNIGSPRINRIFFERPDMAQYPFLQAYDNVVTPLGDLRFTNSKMPFTNITYYKAGSTTQGEERFRSFFSTNVNKNFALGFKFDYTYGRGYYSYANTAHLNSTFFASYTGDRYKMHFIWDYYYMKTAENGGIQDDRYITNPEAMSEGTRQYSASEIPVVFGSTYNAWNRNRMNQILLSHRYVLGFRRVLRKNKDGSTTVISKDSLATSGFLGKLGVIAHNDTTKTKIEENKAGISGGIKPTVSAPKDMLGQTTAIPNGSHTSQIPRGMITGKTPGNSNMNNYSMKPGSPNETPIKPKKDPNIIEEYVPVTSFIHTMRIQTNMRRYYNKAEVDSLYTNTYLNKKSISKDSLQYFSMKNTIAIELMEGFNKWAKAGVTGFISHEFRRYSLMDSVGNGNAKYNEHEVFAGARLTKTQGSSLHFNAIGQLGLLGDALGQFNAKGNADFNFKLLGDTIALIARGEISNTLPSFFMRHYHGNHFWWDNNNLGKIFETKLEGEFTSKHLGTSIKVNVNNIKNYTYLGAKNLPIQLSGSLQVISAQLTQNFKLGILHLDNEITYQKSSDDVALPLPDLSLYHNLYIDYLWKAKALRIQAGVDMRYFTKYYAPAYSPELGMYHTQDETDGVRLGCYPIVDFYFNIHLKRTRFYFMMYNFMHGKGNSMEFYVPHYPINPSIFKMGISINLFD